MRRTNRFTFALLGTLLLVPACAPADKAPAVSSASVPVLAKAGSYLGGGALPGGLDLVPPPPAAGSAREARDLAGAEAAVAAQSGPRWELAARDANLGPGQVADAFACAAGLPLDKARVPLLVGLIDRVMADLGGSTAEVKHRYMRQRPFMVNGKALCTPTWEVALRRDGSYPSGHSAIGFGTGLILARIMPERAAALTARGRAFGDSRRVCNAHWLSDIEEGRVIAAATVARLDADPRFRADIAAVRAEVEAARTSAPALPEGCAAEGAALGSTSAW